MFLRCYFFINKDEFFCFLEFLVYLCVSISAPVLLFMQTKFKGEMQNMSRTCCCTSFICVLLSVICQTVRFFSVLLLLFSAM